MLFLQTTTPDTASYLLLWFVIFAIVGGGWIFSFQRRSAQLKRDRAVIEELLADKKSGDLFTD